MALKTQVLTEPGNPFIRTRLAHVLEVDAISNILANALGLNDHLVSAIAHGHDIGHVPLGHPGEHFLAKHIGRKEFCHEILGPLVAQKIERKGQGLNLTWETLDGMMRHSGNTARPEMTQEAWVVRYGDKFAYIFADYSDLSKRMKCPIPAELTELMNKFGISQRSRTSLAMAGLIVESAEMKRVSFEHSELAKNFARLRELMMGVYVHVTEQSLGGIIEPVLKFLETLNLGDPYLLFALMTDKDVIYLANKSNRNFTHLQDTALAERLPYLESIGKLDLCNPYLDW
ncbi:HD domain-containing protein [Candidatus Parcubacteria bacterium]|nr:HD domain-containing protein [Candidatus Parcubacteria bacterium]